jgi:hypothetical protein
MPGYESHLFFEGADRDAQIKIRGKAPVHVVGFGLIRTDAVIHQTGGQAGPWANVRESGVNAQRRRASDCRKIWGEGEFEPD